MIRTTFRQLEIFVAIAKFGTVTEASRHVGLTQSAASMALAELERLIGTALFDRNSKRLSLNESGRILYPKAIELIERVTEINTMLDTGISVHLRLGASSTIGNYLMPDVISTFSNAHKNSRFTLEVGNSMSIIMAVKNFEIDIGFIEAPYYDADISSTFWRDDELAICPRRRTRCPLCPRCPKNTFRRPDGYCAKGGLAYGKSWQRSSANNWDP